jgi:hypothetical protein
MSEDLSPAVAVRSDSMAHDGRRKGQLEASAHLEDVSIAAAMNTHTIEWMATIRIWAFRFHAGQLIGASGACVSEVATSVPQILNFPQRMSEDLSPAVAVRSDSMAHDGRRFRVNEALVTRK